MTALSHRLKAICSEDHHACSDNQLQCWYANVLPSDATLSLATIGNSNLRRIACM